MKKRLYALVLILVLVIMSLCACGDEATPTKKPSSSSSNNQNTNDNDNNDNNDNNDKNDNNDNNDVDIPGEVGSQVTAAPKFADYIIDNKFINGIYTRDKFDYSSIADRVAACKTHEEIRKLLFEYGGYAEASVTFTLSSDDQVEEVIKKANEYKNESELATIVVEGNVTIDGNKIANPDPYSTNKAISTTAVDYIIKSGSTLTYSTAGVALRYSSSYDKGFPVIIVEDGAKLIIENKSNLLADEAIFFICQGGSLEIKDSTVDMMGLVNQGTVTLTASNPSNYEGRCWATARDMFINGNGATFSLKEASFDAECDNSAYRYGYWYTDYFTDEYGKHMDAALDYAFSYNPHCYNFGTIDIDCSGEAGFEFDGTVYDEEVFHYYPGVNVGTININGVGRRQLEFSSHVQNYGTININGNLDTKRWGDSEVLVNGNNCYFENYGVINCGSGKGNAMHINEFFLNYAGASINEGRKGSYYSVNIEGLAFDKVIAENKLVTIDEALISKYKDENWKNTYSNPSDDGFGEYATFYCYNHQVSVDFSAFFGENGEKYVYFYASADLYRVFDGSKMVVERTSDEYGGRSVLTIIPAEDFSSFDYVLENESYGTKSGNVKLRQ